MESNSLVFSIHISPDPPEQVSPGHSKILYCSFEVATWSLFSLGIWVLLGFFFSIAKTIFALYRISRLLAILRGLIFCLSHVHYLVLRDNVQGDDEYTVVYLEAKYTIN